MSTVSRDQEIVAALAKKIGATLTAKEIKYDKMGNLLELDLSEFGLTQLPSELWQLTSLRTLNLGYNRLSYLPPEISQLTYLQQLYLSTNHLSHLGTSGK
jgi:Leucine-rich repeat (LRR) protein